MNYESITLDVTDGVARVVLNQPAIGNPFNEILCAEWPLLANELASRNDVRVILLSATGKYFSVGGDINAFARSDDLPHLIRKWTGALHAGIVRMARLDAPMIAVVHGSVMGAGIGVMAACDLVFASRSATVGSAYTGIGFSCDAGASTALAARMGVARARRFLLLNEKLTADNALQLGLVDVVCDDDKITAESEVAAIRLAKGPTRAYGEIRRLFATVLSQSLEKQIEDEAQALSRIAGSGDAREGISAFLEKRTPNFENC